MNSLSRHVPKRVSQIARPVLGALMCVVGFTGIFVGLLAMISISIRASASSKPVTFAFAVALVSIVAGYLVLRDRKPLWCVLLSAVCLAGVGAGASIVLRAALHDSAQLLGRPGIVALICVGFGISAGWMLRVAQRRHFPK